MDNDRLEAHNILQRIRAGQAGLNPGAVMNNANNNLRRGFGELGEEDETLRDDFEREALFPEQPNPNNIMDNIKNLIKVRHLTHDERHAFHKPLNDWKETPKGEVCFNSSSIQVDDIVKKFEEVN